MAVAACQSINKWDLPNIMVRFVLLRLENFLCEHTLTKAYTELTCQNKSLKQGEAKVVCEAAMSTGTMRHSLWLL